MYRTYEVIVSKSSNKSLYEYFKINSNLAKNLKNAVLFRLRQTYTAQNKEILSNFEKEVRNEMNILKAKGHLLTNQLPNAFQLQRLFELTHNPDYFSTLPKQTANSCIKEVVASFSSFLSLQKKWQQNQSSLLGKPKIPHYIKSDITTYIIHKKDISLTPIYLNHIYQGLECTLPNTTEAVFISHLKANTKLVHIKVKPYYDTFKLSFVYAIADNIKPKVLTHCAGIDLGVDNIVTLVSNNNLCLIYKGTAIKSKNQFYNKEKARKTSKLKKEHPTLKHVTSKKIQKLSKHRDLFIKDQMHKISRSIINYSKTYQIGKLYIGNNKFWKQNANLGNVANQKFVQIPLDILKQMITYKAKDAGIQVIEVEESYTSKADFLSCDFIPTHGVNDSHTHFKGKRIQRGLYQSSNKQLINADINAAANILKKHYKEAFNSVTNYEYLFHPIIITFDTLNAKK